ncbi:hypothetical protein SDC9_85653 [bioreactor metagenome]|uniref:Uncharacterized protein n=1 Tax=bioreactor metagenome TaxID=1076179 RepID=A0A644ZDT0_9ZZZZ
MYFVAVTIKVSTDESAVKFIVAVPPLTVPVPRITSFSETVTNASLVLQETVSWLVPMGTVAGWVTVMVFGVSVLIIREGSPNTVHVSVISSPPVP